MAQALLSEPEVLILDEPLSGLDPIGRKEFRDIFLERARAGTAVMFSSHILPDVEMTADRVAFINEGVVADEGALSELLGREASGVDVQASHLPVDVASRLAARAVSRERRADADRFVVRTEADAAALVREILDAGGHLVEVVPRHGSLEDLLLRLAGKRPEPSS
jgi:ABC-2 type transport system ATP-binding protein